METVFWEDGAVCRPGRLSKDLARRIFERGLETSEDASEVRCGVPHPPSHLGYMKSLEFGQTFGCSLGLTVGSKPTETLAQLLTAESITWSSLNIGSPGDAKMCGRNVRSRSWAHGDAVPDHCGAVSWHGHRSRRASPHFAIAFGSPKRSEDGSWPFFGCCAATQKVEVKRQGCKNALKVGHLEQEETDEPSKKKKRRKRRTHCRR